MESLKYPVKSPALADLIDEIKNNQIVNPRAVRDLCRKLIAYGTKQNCTYSLAFGKISISEYYASIGDIDVCLTYLLDALEICNQNHYNDLSIRNYNLLGNVYTEFMDHLTALDNYLHALELASNSNNETSQISIYNNIGNIFFELNIYENAVTYFEVARIKMEKLTLEETTHNTQMLGIIYSNLATVYIKLRKLELGQKYLDISKKYISHPHDFVSVIYKVNKATLLNEQGKFDEMLAILDELLEYPDLDKQQENMFEQYASAFLLLLQHHDKERLSKYLTTLQIFNKSVNNYYRSRQFQTLYVQYLEEFETDSSKILDAYRELYRLNLLVNQKERTNLSKSLELKIELFNEKNEKAQLLETSQELAKISQYDELTGIMNRRGYNVQLAELVEKSKQANKMIGLILLDIDSFKEYNDHYGHSAGDRILRYISKLLKKYSNDSIIPCRFGGDEFAIICYDCLNQEIEDYINSIMSELASHKIEHISSKLNSNHLTISLGYVNTNYDENVTPKWLLVSADTALYYSKEHGRNQYCNYTNIK